MIDDITQGISPVTALPGLLAENRPAAVNQLVEEELPQLSIELENLTGQLNTFIDQTNQTALDVEADKNSAQESATIASSLANYKGEYSNLTTYSKGQSVSSGGLYYISKVDGNLNNLVTNATYWLPNPINDKINKNLSPETEKTTPLDADLIPLSDSAASFGLKKLSWANLKATIMLSFGVMTNTLTAKTTVVANDLIVIADSAASNASKKVTLTNLKTFISPASSETVAGIIELATSAEAQTGTNDTTAITPLKLRNAFNATGTAPIYAKRAWAVINGTGTIAIRGSGNISSITDSGVGTYDFNMTIAMPDVNYALTALSGVSGSTGATLDSSNLVTRTVTTFRIVTTNGGEAATADAQYLNVTVTR